VEIRSSAFTYLFRRHDLVLGWISRGETQVEVAGGLLLRDRIDRVVSSDETRAICVLQVINSAVDASHDGDGDHQENRVLHGVSRTGSCDARIVRDDNGTKVPSAVTDAGLVNPR